MQEKSLFWFRRDLRLKDNHGLYQALKSGRHVVCVYIFDTNILSRLDKKDLRVDFIHQSVLALKKEIESHGSSLDIRFGDPLKVFPHLIRTYNFKTVFANHDYDPYSIERDNTVALLLQQHDAKIKTFKDHVIFEKKQLLTAQDQPFTVFGAYAKKWKESINFNQVSLYKSETKLHRLEPMISLIPPTLEEMGFNKSSLFIEEPSLNELDMRKYEYTRDFPSLRSGTSRLGPYLRFGTISIRECVNFALTHSDAFLNELIWRDFFAQALSNFPYTVTKSFKKNYDKIQWENNEELFQKWCDGRTGFPLVDAGMRELNATGYINNRVRMVVASFLCKNLRIDWRWGERYFAKKLLDYDLASNIGNWQWIAGSGVDAAPYFKVFNPSSQTEKYDFQHFYIQKWVPEYKSPDYIKPIVDYADSRDICFKMYKKAIITP